MMIGLCLLFAEFIILSPAMDESLTELFQSAANYVRSVAGRLKADDLLYLYARFKQVSKRFCQNVSNITDTVTLQIKYFVFLIRCLI